VSESSEVAVWMVERTFSEDSPNIIVVTYATPDGERYFQKEWAYNRFGSASSAPVVTAAKTVGAEQLSAVEDAELVERYRAEAERMRARHDPDDSV